MGDPGYCNLFVDVRLSEKSLVEFIRRKTSGVLNRFHVDCDWGSLYVDKNDQYAFWKRRGEDGFLYYRYIVEIHPREDTAFPAYVASLKQLIGDLRALGARTVAACDFEDQLRVEDAGDEGR